MYGIGDVRIAESPVYVGAVEGDAVFLELQILYVFFCLFRTAPVFDMRGYPLAL
jgi:hypothetical protein